MYFGLIFGNIAFLTIRSFAKHKVRLDKLMIQSKMIPNIDTILAL